MVTPAVNGIDPFKIAGRSISGWIPSLKTDTVFPLRQPFCSQLEERLLLWLEYNPQEISYARGDIGAAWAATYRLPTPRDTSFASGYTFEGKPYDYLPDAVGMLSNGTFFIAEAGMEDDTWQDRNLGQRPHDAWRVSDGVSSGLARNERSRYEICLSLKNER